MTYNFEDLRKQVFGGNGTGNPPTKQVVLLDLSAKIQSTSFCRSAGRAFYALKNAGIYTEVPQTRRTIMQRYEVADHAERFYADLRGENIKVSPGATDAPDEYATEWLAAEVEYIAKLEAEKAYDAMALSYYEHEAYCAAQDEEYTEWWYDQADQYGGY